MNDVGELERVVRRSALGWRFIDVATGETAVDGLQVELYAAARPWRRAPALPNRSGVYVAAAVPGLRDFELGLPADDAAWSTTPPRTVRVSVSDPRRRYLPFSFDALAPTRGLYSLLAPWLSPPLSLPVGLPQDAGSPPTTAPGGVPLFSAPSRALPDPLAVVRAQLREAGRDEPAAGALLGVAISERSRGVGLADGQGRVAVMFPFPEPARRRLASPPEPRDDFSWSLDLTAFSTPGASPPAAAAAEPPDLAVLLGQLQQPRTVIVSRLSPAPPLRLDYRVPVTARTAGGSAADASFLFFA